MLIKVSELTGAALDWAVAKCEGDEVWLHKGQLETRWTENGWKPSTYWAQGGPIIERENISVTATGFPWWQCEDGWYAHHGNELYAYGDTPLIAAMRCYVASQLGEEIELPEELK